MNVNMQHCHAGVWKITTMARRRHPEEHGLTTNAHFIQHHSTPASISDSTPTHNRMASDATVDAETWRKLKKKNIFVIFNHIPLVLRNRNNTLAGSSTRISLDAKGKGKAQVTVRSEGMNKSIVCHAPSPSAYHYLLAPQPPKMRNLSTTGIHHIQ